MKTKPTWSPDSTVWERLKPTGPDSVRTAWGNVVGEHGQYLRYWSNEKWYPPYTWSGRVRPISTMIPPIFDSPRPDNSGNITDICWYTPALNFYPQRIDGANHTLLQVGSQADFTKVGTTAKLGNKYGVRTGYVSRTFKRLPKSPWDGRWHDFRIDVLSHSHYQLWWDGVLVADVVEKEPATMEGATRVGFRLDFCDVEFADMTVEGEQTVTMYPDGYGTSKITFEQMVEKHSTNMHPEFARRLFAYLKHKNGLLGVGGGYRPPGTQPDGTPGFAPPGKSFHEGQTWASGIVAYAAVDLVKPNPFNALDKHVAPAWSDTEDAPSWGLHTFVKNEPWHIQPIEIRGWQTWYDNGRKDPIRFALPGETLPPPTPDPAEEVEMIALDHKPGTPEWTALSWSGVELSHVFNGHADGVLRRAKVPRQTVTDAELDGIIASSTTKTACPSVWNGTPRGAAWNAQRG